MLNTQYRFPPYRIIGLSTHTQKANVDYSLDIKNRKLTLALICNYIGVFFERINEDFLQCFFLQI